MVTGALADTTIEIDMGPRIVWVRVRGQWVEIGEGDYLEHWPHVRPLDAEETARANAAAEWLS